MNHNPLRVLVTLSLALALALALASLACSCATAPRGPEGAGETVPLAGNYKVHRFKLKNGLTALVVEDHSSPTFAYQTWFRVGSRNEVPGRTGLAHLFEHMMFKQTKSLKEGEFDRILEGAGAEGENAFTSQDYTAYVQELPSGQANLELIARLEADRMVNLVVDRAAFRTETEVVQNERRYRNENSPDGQMHQELFSTAFKTHPYHWPVIGYQEDLERMTEDDAMKFYRAHYTPSHATVAIVGDVTPEQALSTLEKYYGQLPSSQAASEAVSPEPPQSGPRRKALKLNIQVEKLLVGYRTPELLSPDMPALTVLSSVLSGGKSSRLHRALVETGIASSVGSYGLEDQDPSLFVVAVSLQKGKRAAEADAVLLQEISRVAREGVTAKELERARNGLDFSFYEGLDSNSEIAHFLGRYETVAGDFRHGVELRERIRSVTPDQVRSAALRYLDPKNRTIVIGAPK
jgi:zinc protease